MLRECERDKLGFWLPLFDIDTDREKLPDFDWLVLWNSDTLKDCERLWLILALSDSVTSVSCTPQMIIS